MPHVGPSTREHHGNESRNTRNPPRTTQAGAHRAQETTHPRRCRRLTADDAARSTLTLYENALKLMQAGKYEKAHAPSTRCSRPRPTTSPTASACTSPPASRRSHKGATDFETHEERYDYAISLLNQGNYEDAREHFQAILLEEEVRRLRLLWPRPARQHDRRHHDSCIEHLTEAIRLNARTASRPAPTPTSTASPTIPASPSSSTPKSDQRPYVVTPFVPRKLRAAHPVRMFTVRTTLVVDA